jgi:hypothetical protein
MLLRVVQLIAALKYSRVFKGGVQKIMFDVIDCCCGILGLVAMII